MLVFLRNMNGGCFVFSVHDEAALGGAAGVVWVMYRSFRIRVRCTWPEQRRDGLACLWQRSRRDAVFLFAADRSVERDEAAGGVDFPYRGYLKRQQWMEAQRPGDDADSGGGH